MPFLRWLLAIFVVLPLLLGGATLTIGALATLELGPALAGTLAVLIGYALMNKLREYEPENR